MSDKEEMGVFKGDSEGLESCVVSGRFCVISRLLFVTRFVPNYLYFSICE